MNRTTHDPQIQLVACGLKRSFQIGKRKIEVLRGVDMEVRVGECIFICGASGAGKTTLLYTLAGMERPEEGEVRFEGQSLYAMGDNRRAGVRNKSMGFVFQGYFLLPELTAMENVMLPSLIGRKHSEDAALELLDRVGLAERSQHLPSELSGGEQQRVAIARALINNPAIVFADEPTGNLDSKNGELIFNLLLQVVRERGKTLMVVTHDTDLAKWGDRKIMVQDGQLAMT